MLDQGQRSGYFFPFFFDAGPSGTVLIVIYLFIFLALLCDTWDLISTTRDGPCPLVRSLNHWITTSKSLSFDSKLLKTSVLQIDGLGEVCASKFMGEQYYNFYLSIFSTFIFKYILFILYIINNDNSQQYIVQTMCWILKSFKLIWCFKSNLSFIWCLKSLFWCLK